MKEIMTIEEVKQAQKKLNLKKYYDYANNFLSENFNLKLNVPIKKNNRIKKKAGYVLFKGDVPQEIILSSQIFAKNELFGKIDENYEILGHELVHYALSLLDKPFKDGEDYFEETLIKLNLPSSYLTKNTKNTKRLIDNIVKVSLWLDEKTGKTFETRKYHNNNTVAKLTRTLKDGTKIIGTKIIDQYYKKVS